MGLKSINEQGDTACKHQWVARSKKTIQILERACTECGRTEFHTEADLDEKTVKQLMKVN